MNEETKTMEQPVSEQVDVTEVINEDEVKEKTFNVEENATPESPKGSIGKFKDTESLFNAYNNLQAEFTRKCQRLSELEHSEKADDKANIDEYIQKNPDLVKGILEHYLQDIKTNTVPLSISSAVGSGIPLVAPPTPKSMEEARQVLKNYFK